MKNYYEILEVDKNASQEVIEKAYKALTKKYHPDLQQGQNQQKYTEKMKIINEAYDVLSDTYKREQYNQKLQNEQNQHQTMSREQQERILQENYVLRQQLDKMGNNTEAVYESRGYKIKYKHDFKHYLKAFMFLAITIFLCFLIYQIPFVKKFFHELYNENVVFQAIVDIFKNTFSTTF